MALRVLQLSKEEIKPRLSLPGEDPDAIAPKRVWYAGQHTERPEKLKISGRWSAIKDSSSRYQLENLGSPARVYAQPLQLSVRISFMH